jgi:exodeoxyribonuclease VII large subunit
VRDPAQLEDDERLQVRVAGGRFPVRVDRGGQNVSGTREDESS